MPALLNQVSRYFSDKPHAKHLCPACSKGSLVPDQKSFTVIEPAHSKRDRGHDDWDPFWIADRFSFLSKCDRASCEEIAFVSGVGTVDQRYDENFETEYYDSFEIRSFSPAPKIINVPNGTPPEVEKLLKKSFVLFWVDISAASNALRASLEALLNELGIPKDQKIKGKTKKLSLHARIENWAKKEKDNAELCFALKEVGNLGSHGEKVLEKHYLGSLEIFSHILVQLFENHAEKMKALAKKIADEIKDAKAT